MKTGISLVLACYASFKSNYDIIVPQLASKSRNKLTFFMAARRSPIRTTRGETETAEEIAKGSPFQMISFYTFTPAKIVKILLPERKRTIISRIRIKN